MKLIPVFLVVMLALTGCVTETTGTVKKEVDPEEVRDRLINLGVGYLRQRDFARAKENLRKAEKIDPDFPLIHTTYGVLFQLEGENKLAEQHFRRALRLDPDFSQARNNYGAFLFAQGRYEDAIKQLTEASKNRFYNKRPQVFENLGVAYLRTGKKDKAEEAFRRAVALNFNQSRALLELASIEFDKKNYVEARQLYDRHAKTSQQSSRSLWLCIRLARVFQDSDQESSCALVLKNIFPATEEYKQYQQTL